MAMKKWAMVIMNAGYDPEKDMARLDLEQVETHILTAVSYTHLDVYKRQAFRWRKSRRHTALRREPWITAS